MGMYHGGPPGMQGGMPPPGMGTFTTLPCGGGEESVCAVVSEKAASGLLTPRKVVFSPAVPVPHWWMARRGHRTALCRDLPSRSFEPPDADFSSSCCHL